MKILGEYLEQWISEGISMGFTPLVEALLPFTIEQVTIFIATFFNIILNFYPVVNSL